MGWTPADVDACGLWEFHAAVEGYRLAHGGKEGGGSGDIDDDDMRGMGIEGF